MLPEPLKKVPEAMLMILPLLCFFMIGITALLQRKTPLRLTSNTRSHSSNANSSDPKEGTASDVEHLAASLFLHDRDHRFAAKEDAFEVNFQYSVPLLQRQFFQRSFPKFLGDVDRRVVEQDVDAPVFVDGLAHQCLDIGKAAHVGGV